MNGGSWWRGRGLAWNPASETQEQRRQRWIIETKTNTNIAPRERPDEYMAHRDAFIATGDPDQLRMMLEYVR